MTRASAPEVRRAFSLYCFLRNPLCLTGSDFVGAACDFLLPCSLDVWIPDHIQAGNQVSGQFGTFMIGKCQSLLQELLSVMSHS